MKKKLLSVLLFLLAFGLILTGCGGDGIVGTSVTNTSVEGQAGKGQTSKNPVSDIDSPQLEESGVKEDGSQTPEQKNTSIANTDQQEFSFADLRSVENDQESYWVLEYGEGKEYPFVVVCNTREELQRSLVERFGLSQQAAALCMDSYSNTYFQTKSLLLLQMRKGDTSRRLFVDSISVMNKELYLSLTIENPHNGGTVVQEVLYHVEVEGKLGELTTAVCSVYETEFDVEPKRYTRTISLS